MDENALIGAALCLLALLVFILVRPALRASRRDEQAVEASEEGPVAAMPPPRRPEPVPNLAGPHERAARLVATG